MLIRNYMEETAIGENSQTKGNVTITYENVNYSDLVKELENSYPMILIRNTTPLINKKQYHK
mgnify:CR=1 FL=1